MVKYFGRFPDKWESMKKENAPKSEREHFIEVWGLVHNNTRMFSYWMNKSELSLTEKKLLKAFYLYHKNKKNECLELVKTAPITDKFLEGVRLYLIGLCYNQFCHYFYAIENLERSIQNFVKAKETEFILNPLCLLANVYGNRREIKKMADCLDHIKEYPAKTDLRILQVFYVEICYYNVTDQLIKAEQLFKRVEAMNNGEFEIFRPYFLVVMFMLYTKEKDYQKCYKILEQYKDISGHVVKANYAYMKLLLDHLSNGKTLYIYDKEFLEFPEMHHQLEVIRAFQMGDLKAAQNAWAKLSKHNPELYKDNFHFNGDRTLFYQVLLTYQGYFQSTQITSSMLEKYETQIEKLDFIFSSSLSPLSKSELIRLIWNEEVSESTSARLRKLISTYSKKYGHEVKSHQSTYRLIRKAS